MKMQPCKYLEQEHSGPGDQCVQRPWVWNVEQRTDGNATQWTRGTVEGDEMVGGGRNQVTWGLVASGRTWTFFRVPWETPRGFE